VASAASLKVAKAWPKLAKIGGWLARHLEGKAIEENENLGSDKCIETCAGGAGGGGVAASGLQASAMAKKLSVQMHG